MEMGGGTTNIANWFSHDWITICLVSCVTLGVRTTAKLLT
jgi:hypothetical protein